MDGMGRVLEKFWRDRNGEIDWHSASWLHPERAAPAGDQLYHVTLISHVFHLSVIM